jgi:ectoine hydroxylase-related dioxygenase (phytanoyl-CoA dioxygenase family)
MDTPSIGKNGKSLQNALESLRYTGYAVVEGLLETSLIRTTREAMYRAQEAILRDIGEERLKRAGEREAFCA